MVLCTLQSSCSEKGMNPTSWQEQLGWLRKRSPRFSPVDAADLTNALHRALSADCHDSNVTAASVNSPNSKIAINLELEEQLRGHRLALGPSSSLSTLAASLAIGPVVCSPPTTVQDTDTSAVERTTVFGTGGGLSGALWYYTADHRFVFKSLRQEELDTLSSLLPELTRHVATAKAELGFGEASGVATPAYSVVVRVRTSALRHEHHGSNQGFFSDQRYTPGSTIVLVVMPNIFWRDGNGSSENCGKVSEAYDIKGSGYRFRTSAEEGLGPLKDLNWCPKYTNDNRELSLFNLYMLSYEGVLLYAPHSCREDITRTPAAESSRPHRVLCLGAQRKHELLSTLARDCAWLEAHGRMDYSLLVAVGPQSSNDKPLPLSPNLDWWASSEHGFFSSSQDSKGTASPDGSQPSKCLANEQSWHRLGLVDILASYSIRKRLEAEIRVRFLAEERSRLSSVNPSVYSVRLQSFVDKHSE